MIKKFDKNLSTVKYKLWRFGWTFHCVHTYAESFTLIDRHGTWIGLFGKIIWLREVRL